MEHSQHDAPVILVVSDGEWAGRSLESVLQARDYVVTRSTSGREAVAMLRQGSFGAIVVEEQLADMPATEFCRLVRREPLGQATPIIVIASRGISPRHRVEVYAAGAWDYCSQPLDVEVLLLKIATFINAKRVLAQGVDASMVDETSNLYTLSGFRRWSRELSARALRGHEPLACLALAPLHNEHVADDVSIIPRDSATLVSTARVVARQRRESDVAAYVGRGTFAILAPATGPTGAEQFSERLKRAGRDGSDREERPVELQVGYSAVPDFATAEVNADELLRRASTALGHLRRSGRASAVLCFDDMLT